MPRIHNTLRTTLAATLLFSLMAVGVKAAKLSYDPRSAETLTYKVVGYTNRKLGRGLTENNQGTVTITRDKNGRMVYSIGIKGICNSCGRHAPFRKGGSFFCTMKFCGGIRNDLEVATKKFLSANINAFKKGRPDIITLKLFPRGKKGGLRGVVEKVFLARVDSAE